MRLCAPLRFSGRCSVSPVNRVEGYQREVGPGAWTARQSLNGAHSPPEDFKQEHINQPGGAAVAEPCPPAIGPREDAGLTDTLTGRSSWTAVTQTQARLQRRRWQRRGPQCHISPPFTPLIAYMLLPNEEIGFTKVHYQVFTSGFTE